MYMIYNDGVCDYTVTATFYYLYKWLTHAPKQS